MDLRKIISFGKNSFIISLPKNWIERNKLKKGDIVGIDENETDLVISSKKEFSKEPSIIRIEIDKITPEQVVSRITNAYMSGYDVLEISSQKFKDETDFVKSILVNLSGLEIINQTNNKIVAKDLINIQEVSIPKLIKRMDMITRAMITDTISCIEGNDCYKSINERDIEVNRIFFLSQRIIKKTINEPSLLKYFQTTPFKLFVEGQIIDSIENIADTQKRIARDSREMELEPKDKRELSALMKEMEKKYVDAITAFYKEDKDTSYGIASERKKTLEVCNKIRDNIIPRCKHPKALPKISMIMENIKQMQTLNVYIADANLLY